MLAPHGGKKSIEDRVMSPGSASVASEIRHEFTPFYQNLQFPVRSSMALRGSMALWEEAFRIETLIRVWILTPRLPSWSTFGQVTQSL